MKKKITYFWTCPHCGSNEYSVENKNKHDCKASMERRAKVTAEKAKKKPVKKLDNKKLIERIKELEAENKALVSHEKDLLSKIKELEKPVNVKDNEKPKKTPKENS